MEIIPPTETKRCRVCGKEKNAVFDFYKRIGYLCKDCHKQIIKKWRKDKCAKGS